MDKIDINEIIKAAAGALDLSNFKGDVVMYKHVEKEMNVAEGGLGEQHIHHHYANEKCEVDEPVSNTITDTVTKCDTIPLDCTEAVKKVIVPTFTIDGGVVLNSSKQIAKATEQVDLTSNVEVAMLMCVCVEVGAVKPSATCPDFVRALIGMRLIDFTDTAAISRMASGMTKKLNGSVKNGKRTPSLPANHLRWPSDDLPIGLRLYETMRSQA